MACFSRSPTTCSLVSGSMENMPYWSAMNASRSSLPAIRPRIHDQTGAMSGKTSGRDASSGASASTASTDITIVAGSRPMSAHRSRSTAILCSSSPRAYVGTFQTSAYRATSGSVYFSPTPPTTMGGRGSCTGPGLIGMSRTR